jgi:hypothetical protein
MVERNDKGKQAPPKGGTRRAVFVFSVIAAD